MPIPAFGHIVGDVSCKDGRKKRHGLSGDCSIQMAQNRVNNSTGSVASKVFRKQKEILKRVAAYLPQRQLTKVNLPFRSKG
jgi:hypothetical protein